MQIETIPLSRLVPSPANVRKAKTDIAGLAASIMAHGLLQNLQVCPNGESYEVIAGGRRLAALKYLAKQQKIAADHGVACEVRERPDAVEISLAENEMREAMHPADQFEAFKKLADDGKGEEEIAARFGVTPHTVRQRLKLAVVSPKLIAAYRKGAMSLDCLMAFTVSDDHRTQEKVWAGLPDYAKQRPEAIRDALTEKHIVADSKLARFVGIAAYEAAGGAVLRDLFDADSAGWLTVAARHHPGSCSQTERIPARISCQWGERRAHIMRHCARHHRAVLANGWSCSQSLPMSCAAPAHTGTPAMRSCSVNSRVRSAASVPARKSRTSAGLALSRAVSAGAS